MSEVAAAPRLEPFPGRTVPSAAALRLARLADAPNIAALYREARGRELAAGEIEDWLENGGALVMQSPEGLLVSALLWREEPGGWRLDRLATLPDYRGQGFGRWMMTRVEALAIKENVPKLALELGAERDDLLGYYRRMGYREDDSCQNSLQDSRAEDGADASRVRLSKPLGGTWQTQGSASGRRR